MPRRECSEQEDQRGYLPDKNRADTPRHEQLGQPACDSANAGSFLPRDANQRVGKSDPDRNPRHPRQRHAPKKAALFQFIHGVSIIYRPCHHERSGWFAKRSSHVVEGYLGPSAALTGYQEVLIKLPHASGLLRHLTPLPFCHPPRFPLALLFHRRTR